MRYYKLIKNGYILIIGTGRGGVEITAEEYNEILAIINNKPEAEPGYDYNLREDLTWEKIEVPIIEPDEEEISDSEALAIITGGVDA